MHCRAHGLKETGRNIITQQQNVYIRKTVKLVLSKIRSMLSQIKGCRNKGLCPLYCRFLIMLYTSQQLFVKWNNTFSSLFRVSNGIKQGGVLSPILFNMYLDVLLLNL